MLPDKIDMWVGAAAQPRVDSNAQELKQWSKKVYGLDFSPMGDVMLQWKEFEATQLTERWRSGTYPEIAQCTPTQMLTQSAKFASFNMETVTVDELDTLPGEVLLDVTRHGEFDRFVGWFVAHFGKGGKPVVLDTGPAAETTHWHQMVFYLDQGVQVRPEQKLAVQLLLDTGGAFNREMHVELGYSLNDANHSRGAKRFAVNILPNQN
jgi:hypothetical protein